MADFNRTQDAAELFANKRKPKTPVKYKIQLSEEQKEGKRVILDNQITVLYGKAGCLAKGTKVLMYDGSFKNVEDVQIGDQLMGPDSTHRNVLDLCRGREQMYWIRQLKGDDYRVNESHILSLTKVQAKKQHRITVDGVRVPDKTREHKSDTKRSVLNISVKDYLNLGNVKYKQLKGYVSGCIDFKHTDLLIDPYYLGLWLGDGHTASIRRISNADPEILEYLQSLGKVTFQGRKDITKSVEVEGLLDAFKKVFNVDKANGLTSKYIPKEYLINSKENRLKLLAGLVDSDGGYSRKCYSIVQKNKVLADDIVFLCRSLGYKTTIKHHTAKMKRSDSSIYTCVVYSIMFSQEGELPLLVERKKSLPLSKFKDRRLTGITIEKDVVDDYYGFELDGDHLFLLSDFTVTHNTSKTTLASITALSMLHNRDANRMTLIRPTVATENIGFLKGSMEDKMGPWFTPVMENLYDIYERKLIDKYFQDGQLRFLPLQFAQGVNFKNEVVIFEEAENATEVQIRMALTRLCDGAKLIFTGDVAQIQLKNQRESGFAKLIEVCNKVEGMAAFELTENRRAKIVQEILNHY
jgi:hypothetical protein